MNNFNKTKQLYHIVNGDGFVSLVNIATYKTFVGEESEFSQIQNHVINEMNAHHIIAWQPSNGDGYEWHIEINEQSDKKAMREFTKLIEVTNQKLYIVNYEDLSMVAQYEDGKLPTSTDDEYFFSLENGYYQVTVKQFFDPETLEGVDDNSLDFEIVISPSLEKSEANVTKIFWQVENENDDFTENNKDEIEDEVENKYVVNALPKIVQEPQSPFATVHWMDVYKGMRFVMMPNPVAYAFNPEDDDEEIELVLSSNNLASVKRRVKLFRKNFVGKIFEVEKIEEECVETDIENSTVKVYVTTLFFNCKGKIYEYEFEGKQNKLRNGNALQIQGLTSADDLDKANELYVGKEFYITVRDWKQFDTNGGILSKTHEAIRFDKVTIHQIGFSSWESAPARIVFLSTNGNNYFIDVAFCCTNSLHKNLLDSTNFFKLFISALKINEECRFENWENIQNGIVQIGMNIAEVKATLGEPYRNYIKEVLGKQKMIFNYENSIYERIYFENGLIDKIERIDLNPEKAIGIQPDVNKD